MLKLSMRGRSHSGDICDAKFARKFTLNYHVKSIHENPKYCDETKKVFHCESCSESFALFRSLRLHILRLHEEIQFKCNDCGTSFAFNDDLKKHIANVHDEENKTLNCIVMIDLQKLYR